MRVEGEREETVREKREMRGRDRVRRGERDIQREKRGRDKVR